MLMEAKTTSMYKVEAATVNVLIQGPRALIW